MSVTARAWLAMTVLIAALDFLFLGLIARDFFHGQVGPILLPDQETRWWAALLFYPLYAGGLTVFVVAPPAHAGAAHVVPRGAFFGLVAYATFDLTMLFGIRGWTPLAALVDVSWGAAVSAFTALAGSRLVARGSPTPP